MLLEWNARVPLRGLQTPAQVTQFRLEIYNALPQVQNHGNSRLVHPRSRLRRKMRSKRSTAGTENRGPNLVSAAGSINPNPTIFSIRLGCTAAAFAKSSRVRREFAVRQRTRACGPKPRGAPPHHGSLFGMFCGGVPVPLSSMECGLPAASSTIEI